MRLPRALAVLVVALGLATTGCAKEAAGFGDADVTFATDMVQHHAQAVQMANLTVGRSDVAAPVQDLAEKIRGEQLLEISAMGNWLSSWDRPVPDTGLEHSDEGHHVAFDQGMPGMMSDADMAALGELKGTRFERRWLEMMVEHHRGAITMARTEIEDGESDKAVALAKSIVAGQTAEIARMKAMIAQLR